MAAIENALYLRPSLRSRIGAALLLSLVATVGLLVLQERRIPIADEFFYLRHGLAIHETGTYGEMQPDGTVLPGLAAPLYPALLAGAMALDAEFADKAACWVQAAATDPAVCGTGFGLAGVASAALMGLAAGLIYLAGVLLLGSHGAGLLAAGIWLASGVPGEFSEALLTEAVTVPLFMAGSLLLALGLKRRRRLLLVVAGVAFGAAALGRPSYLYGGILITILTPLIWHFVAEARSGYKAAVGAGLAFGLAFAAIVGPWEVQKHSSLHGEAQFKGYAAHTLVYRVAYNDMTPREYAAAWLYWIPDFGDVWARGLLGPDSIARFSFGAEEGFYTSVARDLMQEVQQATGMSLGLRSQQVSETATLSPMAYVLREEVLGELHRYVPVTLVLTWRGAFPGKLFGLFGLAALVAVVLGCAGREARRDVAIIALPAVVMTALHAAISLNIPRYNIPLLLPYALALAAVLQVGARSLWRKTR
jgi:hypothetical protein